MRQALLIAGCHRSGTSILTRALGRLGWQLPENVLPANSANPDGFWEPEQLVQFNERLLWRLDRGWLDPKPILPEALASLSTPDLLAEAADLLMAAFAEDSPPVIKDPRLSLLLPFWRNVLAGMGIAPAVLIAVRPPAEVTASLERRDGLTRGHGEALWLTYTLQAEAGSRAMPRGLVFHDRLCAAPRETLDRALAAIGVHQIFPEEAWRGVEAMIRTEPAKTRPVPGPALIRSVVNQAEVPDGLADGPAWDDLNRQWHESWRNELLAAGSSRLALSHPETHIAVARREIEAGRPGKCLSAARRAARMLAQRKPGLRHLHLALAALFEQAGSLGEALEQAEAADRSGPPASDVMTSLAKLRMLLADYSGAEAVLRAAIDLEPGNNAFEAALALAVAERKALADQ